MDATRIDGGKPEYSTCYRIQAWFLSRSRDNWRQKYKKLKSDAKRLQNRVNDATRGREKWKKEAQELEKELATLREQVALKKSGCDSGGGSASGARAD
jgi:uncharacterized protein YlxW (UPF0749 family)